MNITDIVSIPLGALLGLCHDLLGNYAAAIVIFTLLTKVILFPVSLWVQKNGIAMVRMTPEQVDDLVAGITCRTKVVYADPPQAYLPEPDRSRRARLLPRGELVVVPGGHHLHMEQPAEVAAAIGDFLVR